MATTIIDPATADAHALIMERIERLSLPELGTIGRPLHGKPARFLKVEGDMFVYEVMSKRVPRVHADAAREMLQRGRKMGQTQEAFQADLAKQFESFRTVRMCLKRETVARNAVERIRFQLANPDSGNPPLSVQLEGNLDAKLQATSTDDK